MAMTSTPTLEQQILDALGGDELDGHELAEVVRGWQFANLVPFPSIYLILDRLVSVGTLAVRWDDADDEHPYPRRRLYRLAEARQGAD